MRADLLLLPHQIFHSGEGPLMGLPQLAVSIDKLEL
jgi:hypothetical protein